MWCLQECGCSVIGSVTQQCNINTGCCSCRDTYRGEKCNECQIGFRDFPQVKKIPSLIVVDKRWSFLNSFFIVICQELLYVATEVAKCFSFHLILFLKNVFHNLLSLLLVFYIFSNTQIFEEWNYKILSMNGTENKKNLTCWEVGVDAWFMARLFKKKLIYLFLEMSSFLELSCFRKNPWIFVWAWCSHWHGSKEMVMFSFCTSWLWSGIKIVRALLAPVCLLYCW